MSARAIMAARAEGRGAYMPGRHQTKRDAWVHASSRPTVWNGYLEVAHAQPSAQRQVRWQLQAAPHVQRSAVAAAQAQRSLAHRHSVWVSVLLLMFGLRLGALDCACDSKTQVAEVHYTSVALPRPTERMRRYESFLHLEAEPPRSRIRLGSACPRAMGI